MRIFIRLNWLNNVCNLDRFQEGLQSLGLYEEMRANKEAWREVFIYIPHSLDPLLMDEVFSVSFSAKTGHRYRAEKRTLTYWRDFLQDLHGMLTL